MATAAEGSPLYGAPKPQLRLEVPVTANPLRFKDMQKEKASVNPSFLELENQPQLESLSFWEVKEFVKSFLQFHTFEKNSVLLHLLPWDRGQAIEDSFPPLSTRFFLGCLSSTCCRLSL